MWKIIKNNKQTKWFETKEQAIKYMKKQLNDNTYTITSNKAAIVYIKKDKLFDIEYISNDKLCYIENVYSFINLKKSNINTIIKRLKNTYTYDELAKNTVKYLADNKLENKQLEERNDKYETKFIFTLLNEMVVYDVRDHDENEIGIRYYSNNDKTTSYELVLNIDTIKNKQKIDIRVYSGSDYGNHWIQTTLDYKLDYFTIPILQTLLENIKEVGFGKHKDFFNKVLDILKEIK